MTNPNAPLTGRRAVVTGASRGIGRAIAVELARGGAHVLCVSTRAGGCDDTLREIAAAGGSGEAFAADVSNPDAIAALVDKIVSGGAPSILVNNAGVTKDGSFLRMTAADFDQTVNVNLRGAFLLSQALIRSMTKAPSPRIVFVGSVVGLTGNAGQANYAASKAGLVGLARSIAKEFGSRGLTANVVAPGFIETDMTANLPEKVREQILASVALRRLGTPADVAAVVAFLASDAGAYVTGQVLVVDGGMTI
ncbi:MAG: 3-oxoacyl-ACP reductase FabG [Planctomycetes bacterium]|nr:3-oxoacyl-ACP reductase FabG [Planctomycetota bacterium]